MLNQKELETQLAQTARETVLGLVRASASKVTLTDLLKMAEGASGSFLADMTLAELGSGAKRGRGRPKGSAKPKAKAKAKSDSGGVDVRSKDGRATYRRMVLQVVQRSPGISAQGVGAAAGGTKHQVRTALNFLHGEGLVTHKGATRDRVYSPKAS